MDEDDEKELLKSKVEKINSTKRVNFAKSLFNREAGFKKNNPTVPVDFQVTAEENYIKKDHQVFKCQLPEVTRSTFLMVFSPDGKKVASTHGNHNVYVTDLTTGKNIKTLKGHPRTPWCIAFHPSSNQILATGCLGGQVRVWDLHGGSEIWTAESQTVIASLAFHPVDRMLVIASYNEVYFWDWSRPVPFAKCCTANEKEKVRYVAFDQLGHKLITGVANTPSRGTTMWDRVAAPQHPPQTTQSDQERRITSNNRQSSTPYCYHYMVEQYEQLVHRYLHLSRARAMATMDRGTDPMDLEAEASRSSEQTAANTRRGTEPDSSLDQPNTLTDGPPDIHLLFPTIADNLYNERQQPNSRARNPRRDYLIYNRIFPERSRLFSERSLNSIFRDGDNPGGTNDSVENGNSSSSTSRVHVAGTDERTASRSSSQYFSTPTFLRSSADDTSFNNVPDNARPSEITSSQPSEMNSGDTSQSSSVGFNTFRSDLLRLRRLWLSNSRNSVQSDLSTSNSENVSQQSSGREGSPRSSTSLSLFLGNLGFGGSEPESNSVENVSENGLTQSHSADQLTRPLARTPPDVASSNVRQSTGTEDNDNNLTNVGANGAQRGSGLRLRRRRLFHLNINSDDSPVSSSQQNSPDDTFNDAPNLENSDSRLNSTNLNNTNEQETERRPPRESDFLLILGEASPTNTTRSESALQRQNARRNFLRCREERFLAWQRLASSLEQRLGSRNEAGNSENGSGRSSPRGRTEGQANNGGERDRDLNAFNEHVLRLRRRLCTYRVHSHAQANTQRERQRESALSATDSEEVYDRQFMNRLNEIINRPGTSDRQRRFFISRRSAFQQLRNGSNSNSTQPSTSSTEPNPPNDDSDEGVRYGIQILSRHIDNMQNLCRARLEILQLQQIRRMWEDLQHQLYTLQGSVRDLGNNREENCDSNVSNEGSNVNKNASDSNRGGSSSSGPSRQDSETRSESTASTEPSDSGQLAEPDQSSDNDSDEGQSLITDDESDAGGVEPIETPRSSGPPPRRIPRFSILRSPRMLKRHRPGTASFRPNDGLHRRLPQTHNPGAPRRTRTLNTAQYMRSELSNLSCDSSTSNSDRRSTAIPPRGIKRKTRESDRPPRSNLMSTPGPSLLSNPLPSASTDNSSSRSFAESMRDINLQLGYMLYRQRERFALRNLRVSRFTRQREERMMRNLWDTESSHESGRDDITEEPDQQNRTEEDSEDNRDSLRRRARQILFIMVDSLTQLFERDASTSRRNQNNDALHERIYNLYVLLQLALNLTDLLLAQLVTNRRDAEPPPNPSRRINFTISSDSDLNWRVWNRSRLRYSRIGDWRRTVRRDYPPLPPQPVVREFRRNVPTTSGSSGGGISSSGGGGSRGMPHRHNAVYSNIRSAMLAHRLSVPIVRVNDMPAPPEPPVNFPPRPRPRSPPSPSVFSIINRSANSRTFEDSSEDSPAPEHRSEGIIFMRGYGSDLLTEFAMSPHHRIQAWDFSKFIIPDISDPEKNLVVNECKIHNDASVDVSKDGQLLVTLLPSGRLSMMLGIYSLQWATLGQLLYRTSFEQNAVSVSLSPTSRHLVVGLASRRVVYSYPDREKHTVAQIFRLEGGKVGGTSQGRLELLKNLEMNWSLGFMSLNCIRWASNPGQGLVYGTNTGQLKVLI